MSVNNPDTRERFHIPDHELDMRLLEASRDVANKQLERHLGVKETRNWVIDNFLSNDVLVEILPHVDRVELEEGVGEAVEVFTLTEDAIVWYGRDVTTIFNPTGKQPDDDDPHETFSRNWTSEEFQHAIASRDVARIIGRDMTQLELDRRIVTVAAKVPIPHSTAMGLAYTGVQESNTAGPYQVLVQKFTEHQAAATEAGDDALARIYGLCTDVYREIAQDERLHRTFINAVGKAALHSGDPELQAYMLSALLDTYDNFVMPIQKTIPNKKRFVSLKKADIFTKDTVKNTKLHTLRHGLGVERVVGLTGRGLEMQERLGELMLDLESEEKPELAA